MKKYKNDKERIAFLEDYRNEENGWYLWKEDQDLQRRWWRYDMPEGSLIVEEEERTFTWPKPHRTWSVLKWFIVNDWKDTPIGDQSGSRSQALMKIKEIEKSDIEW